MWIKWKYHDHGAGKNFKELEIPEGYSCPEEYLEEMELVPHWGERYMRGRIEWKKIRKPSIATLRQEIDKERMAVRVHNRRIESLKRTLDKLTADMTPNQKKEEE